jgi:4-hydroxy-tetrahydrodipicolinate reductase
LDAPSGTAITLAEGIIENISRKDSWVEGVEPNAQQIGITSFRRDEVPGIHTIKYESDVDTITITHDAKSRAGFALGAVVAAEFIKDKTGFITMQDMLKF